MPKAKNVTVIPATLNIHTKTPTKERIRRRVAAYARVSTDSEEQLTSYEAQVDYYTRFIQENPDWDFVEVYTDEGISAVNTKRRDGFNRMIRDALAGKIDLIVTKSVSRFARNTVDSLTTIRLLNLWENFPHLALPVHPSPAGFPVPVSFQKSQETSVFLSLTHPEIFFSSAGV